MAEIQKGKLSIGTKLGFGVCDVGGNLFFTVTGFWLVHYLTDVVGILPGLAGTIVLIVRLWDAITDPIMGIISDKTRSPWGRRRPYLLFGSVPLFISMFVLYSSPGFTDQGKLFVWGILAFGLLSTAYTLVNIPYSSLTPELTSDYQEKTSLNGFRMSFAVVGTLLAAGAAMPIVNLFDTKEAGFSAMGAVFGFIMMSAALITFFSVQEPEHEKRAETGLGLSAYKEILKNKAYFLILGPWILNITGLTVVSGTLVYYYKYIFNREDLVTLSMMVLILTALVCIPLWVKISGRYGKKKSYIAGLVILAAALFLTYFFGHTIGPNFMFGIMVFAGIGLSTGYVFPWSIVPDAIEFDARKTGVRKEGAYYGLWTFGSKVGQGLAGALIGGMLDISGYIPGAVQDEAARVAIRSLLGWIPAVVYLGAAVFLLFYPLTKEKYEKLFSNGT